VKYFLNALTILLLSAISINGTPSESADREAFDRRMYSVVHLHGFGTNPEQFASLSDAQKRDLLACRDVLVALFRSLDTNGGTSKYLTSELAKKYRTGADFIEPETSLEQIATLDWNFVDGEKEIQLHFFVILYSEGDWVLSKNTAIFKKSSSGWQISQLKLNDK
jgi:hypothetical protein